MKQGPSSGGLVYSTEGGRMCPGCRRPVAQCSCRSAAPAAPGDGIVRVLRETKGRGGKAVTVVRGVPADVLDTTAKALQYVVDWMIAATYPREAGTTSPGASSA